MLPVARACDAPRTGPCPGGRAVQELAPHPCSLTASVRRRRRACLAPTQTPESAEDGRPSGPRFPLLAESGNGESLFPDSGRIGERGFPPRFPAKSGNGGTGIGDLGLSTKILAASQCAAAPTGSAAASAHCPSLPGRVNCGVGSRRSLASSPTSAAAGPILAPRTGKNTRNPLIKSK